jgi:putative N6-adenine-specific DNA methylase
VANPKSSSRLRGFAVCPTGLEDVLHQELAGMAGFQEVVQGRGGVRFTASAEAIARANLWARIPTRLLVEAGRGTLTKTDDIRIIANKIQWEHWFTFRQTLRIDLAVGREPKLEQPVARNFATLLIKDGICDRFRATRGERPSIDTTFPDIRVWSYIDQNELTIYLDSSGEPLFKRGWRQAKGEAPLRENLAAALVAMTQWDLKSPVMDPFCGSGTLLIEAMQRALGLPPGYAPHSPREFAAERFHAESPMGQVNWRALRAEAKAAIDRVHEGLRKQAMSPGSGISLPAMMGSDRDARMIEIARSNAERALPALAAQSIQWKVCPMNAVTAIADHGLLICNPPYGKRLEQSAQSVDDNVDTDFERSIAETLKRQFAGWQAWILTDDLKLERSMRLKASRRVPVFNGDIECRWMRFDMVAGSMREKHSGSRFSQNLQGVRARIARACAEHQQPPSRIKLLAVSKTFAADVVETAIQAGVTDLGENYVQEGVEKILALGPYREKLQWHFIGPLQSNKTRDVAEHFDWMHTVDRIRIAERLSLQRPESMKPLQVCVQVNVSGEDSKSGVSPEEAATLALQVAALPRLVLRGLMSIPEPTEDVGVQRAQFRALAQLFKTIKSRLPESNREAFDTLSMGMSADLESAIAESIPEANTMVRIGSALFGERAKKTETT